MRILALALMLVPLLALADQATLNAAGEQIKAGQPAGALQALLPLREAEAGNAQFHYLLGLAYLDSGNYVDAISSLKRSLALNPGFLQAKAELGRAYLLDGDTINAYLTFKAVREANPPPEALAGIERYIDQAASQIYPRKKVFGALTLSIGHDTNVNSGTSASEVALPIFGGINATVSPGANPVRDEFLAAGGYVNAFKDITEHLDLVGTAGFNGHYNYHRELNAFDTGDGSVAAGARYTAGADQFQVLGLWDQFNYGGTRLRYETGVALDWRRLTGGPVELDFNYRNTRLDYNDLNNFRNARREVFGLALLPSFFGRRLQYVPPMANVYFGTERPFQQGSENLGYRLWGARGAYYGNLATSTAVFVSGGYEERRYGAPDPVFASTRLDHQTDVTVGLIQSLSATVSLVPSVQWIDARSNIAVYASRRTLSSLTLRKTF